ncbi:MAG TPA: hypothetical protein VFE07_10520, partial [Marmoricola sp.]|nr:hypothetical protein [Marmoricola sp.]
MNLALRTDRLRLLVPRTLTARLVVTAVALVAVVGIMVAASATFAMRSYLMNRLDGELRDTLRATSNSLLSGAPAGVEPGTRGIGSPGTLVAVVPAESPNGAGGVILSRQFKNEEISETTVRSLGQVPSD